MNMNLIRGNALVVGVAALCSAAGVGLGYLVTKKRFESVYAEMLQEEIEKSKEFYKTLYDKKMAEISDIAAEATAKLVFPEPTSENVEKAAEAILSYAGVNEPPKLTKTTEEAWDDLSEDIEEKVEPKKPERVFYNAISKKDSKKVPEARMVPLKSDIPGEELPAHPKAPYIISQEEFMSAKLDFEQETYTYFEQDGVVADQSDTPMERVNDTVGLSNLLRFGELSGSGDPNVLYVRCERLKVDYELVRDTGMYSEKVLDQGSD